MTHTEKCELLKNTIYQLYSKEGRSKSYISKLLEIDRKTLIAKIKEWNLPEPEPAKHLNPSTVKFLNKNRQLIKSRLDNDISITEIAKELGVNRGFINKVLVKTDPVLQKAHTDYLNRIKERAANNKQEHLESSSLNYNKIDGEIWKDIVGYEGYKVSNMGRVIHYSKKYNEYYLLSPSVNDNSGMLYISLYKDDKRKNLNLSRIVAHIFCEGFDFEKTIINHKDGNKQNNRADNLEWISDKDIIK